MDRKAFSLAEMMVVMMVLSIVLSASMPIITKRTSGSGGGGGDLWQNANSNDIYYGDSSGTKRVFIGTNAVPTSNSILSLNTKDGTQNQISFQQGGTQYGKLIANSSAQVGLGNVTLGSTYSTALGYNASATGSGSVAIGSDSTGAGASTTAANTIQLGTANHNVNIPGSQTVGGNISTSGSVTAAGDVTTSGAVYASNWLRTTGNTGWYSQTYGGGWYMIDTTWIRAYNNKNVYTPGTMEAGALQSDGTLSVAGTSTFGGAATYNSGVTYNSSVNFNGNITTPANVVANNMTISNTFTATNLNTPGSLTVGNPSYITITPTWHAPVYHPAIYTGNGAYKCGTWGWGQKCAWTTPGYYTYTSSYTGPSPLANIYGNVSAYSVNAEKVAVAEDLFVHGRILVGNGGIAYYSDKRLKNIKGKFSSGLMKIRQIKTYNYTYKSDKYKILHTGVIAQDLQKIFPNSVVKGSNGYLTIKQDEMFYAMLNSIKELDATVQWLVKNIKLINSKIFVQNKDFLEKYQILELKNKELLAKIVLMDTKIKSLQAKINQLESKDKQMETKMKQINARLDKVEKR